MDGVVTLAIFLSRYEGKATKQREDFCARGNRQPGGEGGERGEERIRWRAMAAFINGGHQTARCPRFRLSALAKGGSIFINAWHPDSCFKYTPSEYHEFVFNKSADEWAHPTTTMLQK